MCSSQASFSSCAHTHTHTQLLIRIVFHLQKTLFWLYVIIKYWIQSYHQGFDPNTDVCRLTALGPPQPPRISSVSLSITI